MTCQRKIPFGYEMQQGIIICNSGESKTVRYIFSSYIKGKSLIQIAEELSKKNVRYNSETQEWNKNMIKRILENGRYLGDQIYPPIIDDNTFYAAQHRKEEKMTYKPSDIPSWIRSHIICGACGAPIIRKGKVNGKGRWYCSDSECRRSIKAEDKELLENVYSLVRKAVSGFQSLSALHKTKITLTPNALRISNELTCALNRGTESTEYLKSLIFACAAERYSELPDMSLQYKINKLRAKMESGNSDETLQQELLKTAVRAIRLTAPDNIALELINGQIITKESAET